MTEVMSTTIESTSRPASLTTMAAMMTEAIRRTVWSVLRVENEFFNNFEQYRAFIAIPPIKEEGDSHEELKNLD